MEKLFRENGIELTPLQIEKFEKFRNLLLFYNEKFNITTITEQKEMNVKHFLDSVLCKDKFVDNSSVIEIGSGGGFPSIPLMIVREDLKFTLVESTGKKCNFLKEVISSLKLNATVINGRAEDFSKDPIYREKYDICTARAVARLNTLCEYCMPFVKVNGTFVSYKGDGAEEVIEAQNAIKVLGGKVKEVKEYYLQDAKRTLISIEKIKPTDKKYPRGNGKERKNPL